jgi:hypothetical protein
MKNKLIKACLTGLALSVAGLAHANPQLSDYSAVSGAAMNIAAGSNVGGSLVAQAAITIGADVTLGASDALPAERPSIYSSAAVTIGAGAMVGNIDAGAAVGIGAGVSAADVNAGAAVVLGADAHVGEIDAGGAITMGAASTGGLLTSGASVIDWNAYALAPEGVGTSSVMDELLHEIATTVQNAASNPHTSSGMSMLSNGVVLSPGVYRENGAITVPANSTIKFDCQDNPDASFRIHAVGAITLGADVVMETINGCTSQAVHWTTEAAITLGAGVLFPGSAYALGAIDATSAALVDGGLYSMAAVNVGPIVSPTPLVVCGLWTPVELANFGSGVGVSMHPRQIILTAEGGTEASLYHGSDGWQGRYITQIGGPVYRTSDLDFGGRGPWQKILQSQSELAVCQDLLRAEISIRGY